MTPTRQAVDARTDLWSLGVVLYRLVTRKYPFGNEPLMKVLKAIATDTPKPLHEVNPEVPVRLSKLVAKLLEKNPDDRPNDAREVIRELNRVWDEGYSSESTATFVGKPAPARRSRAKLISCSVTMTLALCLLVGVGLGISELRQTKATAVAISPKTTTNQNDASIPIIRDAPVEAATPDVPTLAVKFISLQHYANKTPGKDVPEVEPRGILGKDSFEVRLGDVLKVEIELYPPAYCYIVAFRPDGVVECIYPEPAESHKPPEMTDRPRYPSKSRGNYYGLTDGTGLWVFGVVASSKPLQSYQRAITRNKPPKLAGGISPANTVFWDDGKWVETLTKAGTDRGTRGAGAKVQGPGAVTEAADWLKKLTADQDAVSAAIGFMVQPRN